jgi:hypothetical protein
MRAIFVDSKFLAIASAGESAVALGKLQSQSVNRPYLSWLKIGSFTFGKNQSILHLINQF